MGEGIAMEETVSITRKTYDKFIEQGKTINDYLTQGVILKNYVNGSTTIYSAIKPSDALAEITSLGDLLSRATATEVRLREEVGELQRKCHRLEENLLQSNAKNNRLEEEISDLHDIIYATQKEGLATANNLRAQLDVVKEHKPWYMYLDVGWVALLVFCLFILYALAKGDL